MPLVWQVTPERAFGELAADYVQRIEAGVLSIAEDFAPQIAEWMQAEHVWQNRTGEAEHGLHTEVKNMAGEMVQIVLAGGVFYQVYLEYSNGGQYAILAPAVDVWAPRVWGAVVRMFR